MLIRDQGLAFIEWEHFWPIRKLLAESHLRGRSNARTTQVNAVDTSSVVFCNICAVGTQTEESKDPDWEEWILNGVVEDVDIDLKDEGTIAEGEYRVCALETQLEEEEEFEPPKGISPPHAGDEYDRECEKCRQALGMRRLHRHGKSESRNVLSVDLSGPHPEAVGTRFKYMLVAVFNHDPQEKNLPFVRGLSTKTAKETCEAIESVLAELNSILGEQTVVRVHTDAGKEFVNKAVTEMLRSKGIHTTTTGGYDPKANGRAERYVGLMKQRATSYLIHAGIPLKFWYWACTQAAYMYRATVLGLKLPSDAPTFGNRVLVRDPKAEDKRFTKRTKEAIFLCWDTSVIQGAYAMTTKEDGSHTMVAVSGPRPWPRPDCKEVWHLEEEPNGDNTVWISNKGRLIWTPPDNTEVVTFEERNYPDLKVE